jgi:hypothetical protein
MWQDTEEATDPMNGLKTILLLMAMVMVVGACDTLSGLLPTKTVDNPLPFDSKDVIIVFQAGSNLLQPLQIDGVGGTAVFPFLNLDEAELGFDPDLPLQELFIDGGFEETETVRVDSESGYPIQLTLSNIVASLRLLTLNRMGPCDVDDAFCSYEWGNLSRQLVGGSLDFRFTDELPKALEIINAGDEPNRVALVITLRSQGDEASGDLPSGSTMTLPFSAPEAEISFER